MLKIPPLKTCVILPSSNLNQLQHFYIYHKNEKGKPGEMDLLLLKKRYHTNFYRHDIYIFIAGIKDLELMISYRNRKNFMASIF